MRDESKNESDSKAKFREALDKKKKSGSVRPNNFAGNSKLNDGQTNGNAPKIFRRKSGSA